MAWSERYRSIIVGNESLLNGESLGVVDLANECLSAAPTRGVTLITRRATVHIPVHARMREVVLVVVAMAARALENGVISRICMARGAYVVCVAMTRGELGVIAVREGPAGPVDRAYAVAGPALRGWEEIGVLRRRMRWTGRAVVIGQMAGNARVAV